MNYLRPIAGNWMELALQLGLVLEELKIIEATPLLIHGGPTAFLREVLHKWLNRVPPAHTHPTLAKLCDALRSPAMNQVRVANNLEQTYQARSTGLYFRFLW